MLNFEKKLLFLKGTFTFNKLDYFTDYEIRVTVDSKDIYLGSFKKATFGFETPSSVDRLETIRLPDKSLLVNWQPPINSNAPAVCYYQIEVWKPIPHSSYFIKTYIKSAPFKITNQALIDDALIIKVFAINTNLDLNGSNCYESGLNFDKILKSNEAVYYYSPVGNGSSRLIRLNYNFLFCCFTLKFVIFVKNMFL